MINATDFVKIEYTLTDFAKFKLCPMLYANSVLYPDQEPIGKEQKRLKLEAEFLSDAFWSLTEAISASGKSYCANTIQFMADITEHIYNRAREYNAENDCFDEHDMRLITNGVCDKAEYTEADILRRLKGSAYTIIRGTQKRYQTDDFSFIHSCAYAFVDCDNGSVRSIYINEYKDFPVFSAGKRHRHLIHYADILKALDGDNPSTDRMGLAIKIIRKITTQIESGYYLNDGLERIANLGKEIADYDFKHTQKKPSGFCNYCKYFDKCRQFL